MDNRELKYKIVKQLLKRQNAKSLEESNNKSLIKISINTKPEPSIIDQAEEIYNWITDKND